MFEINSNKFVGNLTNPTVGNGSGPTTISVNLQISQVETQEELKSLAETVKKLIIEINGRGSDDSYKHSSGKIKGSVSVRYKNGGTVTDTLI